MVNFSKLNSMMETRDHSKNGASLKSHMSRGNILKMFFIFAILCSFLACNKDGNDTSLNDVTEFTGEYPTPEYVEYSEGRDIFHILAVPGQIVLSSDGLGKIDIVKIVESKGGKIIEEIPSVGHYLVEIKKGNEDEFLKSTANINGLIASLNTVEFPKEKYDYFVFDDYADVNGIQHGEKISEILKQCQNNASIKEISVIKNLCIYKEICAIPLNTTNVFHWNNLLSQDKILVNWSHGPGDASADWTKMSLDEKKSYKKDFELSIKRKIDQIIRLKKKNPNIDIVFAIAAGNERCDEIQDIINIIKLDSKYSEIFEKNILVVSDYSTFANKSSVAGDFATIKEHPYFSLNGGTTSFATPQALCYINQVMNTEMPNGHKLTAVESLNAVKESVKANLKGELILSEAIEAALVKYGGKKPETVSLANTTWHITSKGNDIGDITFNTNGACLYYDEGLKTTLTGTYTLSNNNVKFVFTYFQQTVTYNGTINNNTMTGSVTSVMGSQTVTENFTATRIK